MKVLINYEIAKPFKQATGIDVIPLYPYKKLQNPVSAHADMLFCILDKMIFCYEDYVRENNLLKTFNEYGYNTIFVEKECKKCYPHDISLNVLVMGKQLFCNIENTSTEIIEYAKNNGYELINVKQGYSACSTLVVDENNAITSDSGVAKVLLHQGKNVLKIDNSDIVLNGYNCGFFGGATGRLEKKIFIFGEIEYLSSFPQIKAFLDSCSVEVISILSGRVYDFGGIKLLFPSKKWKFLKNIHCCQFRAKIYFNFYIK